VLFENHGGEVSVSSAEGVARQSRELVLDRSHWNASHFLGRSTRQLPRRSIKAMAGWLKVICYYCLFLLKAVGVPATAYQGRFFVSSQRNISRTRVKKNGCTFFPMRSVPSWT